MMYQTPNEPFPKGTVLLVQHRDTDRHDRVTVETDLGGMALVARDEDGQQVFVWRGMIRQVL